MSDRRSCWAAQCLLPLLVAIALGCTAAPPNDDTEPGPPPWFEDITKQSGLNFVHDAGKPGRYFMPQIMGSGAALFDFNNDGRLDIYLIQNGGPDSGSKNQLYRQEKDGRFTNVSAGSGLDVAGYGMGVAIGDVNNDGWPDVLLTGYGFIKLFLNNGNGTFRDVTKESGLDNILWGMSASFVDYNRDGWLDLVVVNYLDYDSSHECFQLAGRREFCHPKQFPGTVTKLFRNNGTSRRRSEPTRSKEGLAAPTVPQFEDVTLESGLGRKPGPGLGVVCADFNGDGWPDIFVANDAQPNRLWINQGDGTFKDEAVARGVAYASGQAMGNMGVAIGDVDGDCLFDLFVTHLTEECNTLWRQEPAGLFRDRTAAMGLVGTRWRGTGFGAILADFNNDGYLDLAVVNGRVTRGPGPGNQALGPFWGPYAERNQLFANDGGRRFVDISATDPFSGTAALSRGLACGDIGGNGALDLLVTTANGPARLYRNVAPSGGHWLIVRALDPALKRDAYGAVITVNTGQRSWVGSVTPGQSYLCSNDPRVHFGLGQAARVQSILVRWPNGPDETEEFEGCGVDRRVVLRRGEGKKRTPSPKHAAHP
jgi:hypothetical protein